VDGDGAHAEPARRFCCCWHACHSLGLTGANELEFLEFLELKEPYDALTIDHDVQA
jgi:hypothetical protein